MQEWQEQYNARKKTGNNSRKRQQQGVQCKAVGVWEAALYCGTASSHGRLVSLPESACMGCTVQGRPVRWRRKRCNHVDSAARRVCLAASPQGDRRPPSTASPRHTSVCLLHSVVFFLLFIVSHSSSGGFGAFGAVNAPRTNQHKCLP
jgi:hypothetical protein